MTRCLPGMTGIELHERLLLSGHAIPTILVTAYPDEDVKARVLRAGVVCYLSKPVDDYELDQCILTALKRAPPIRAYGRKSPPPRRREEEFRLWRARFLACIDRNRIG